jgi:peptide deformylase
MTLNIEIYGNEVLRRQSTPVVSVDEGLRQLARDMLETMYANHGAGLAAQQVGRTECICVIDVTPPAELDDPAQAAAAEGVPMPIVLINPEIVASDGTQSGPEGCLSFPELFVNIGRSETVQVSFLDLDGVSRQIQADGLLARAIQHEVDHLNGVLLVDRMSPVQKMAVGAKLKRLKKCGAAQAAREKT